MRRLFVATLFLFVIPLKDACAGDPVEGRDWSVKASPSLVEKPPAIADLRKFVNETLNADMNPAVCSFRFTDVAHDGVYRLVAVLDASGRHLCNQLVMIGKKDQKFVVLNQWKVFGLDDVSSAFQDLDHDGREELVLPMSWTPYEGVTHCVATWQGIFGWDTDRYADRGTSFPGFYKSRQKDLKTKQENSLGLDRNGICVQMEIDKISRYLMIDPRAGFTAAEEWMKDPDSSTRRKAAAVFADIADGASRSDLATLATDSDTLVSETAKMYLAGRH